MRLPQIEGRDYSQVYLSILLSWNSISHERRHLWMQIRSWLIGWE